MSAPFLYAVERQIITCLLMHLDRYGIVPLFLLNHFVVLVIEPAAFFVFVSATCPTILEWQEPRGCFEKPASNATSFIGFSISK